MQYDNPSIRTYWTCGSDWSNRTYRAHGTNRGSGTNGAYWTSRAEWNVRIGG